VRIAIVTPWKDHPELYESYFRAVGPELQPGDELLVIDDFSNEPLHWARIRTRRAMGFSGASNVGLLHARTEAVVFLNNDIALGEEGWLAQMRDAIEPGVLAGPLRSGSHTDVDGHRLPYIDGWCLGGMRDELLELGGFNTSLEEPAYYSDNLLCLEARAAGMTLREVRVTLQHLENVTAGRASNPDVIAATSANRARYQARARELLAAV
jgi:GT2 family glycosyltransferase